MTTQLAMLALLGGEKLLDKRPLARFQREGAKRNPYSVLL